MKNYKAILFHPEGDFVTDFSGNDKQKIWDQINNMGSRWVFYPIPFVATDKTIVDTPEGMEHFKGRRISTLIKFLKEQWELNADKICEALNSGAPLWHIY